MSSPQLACQSRRQALGGEGYARSLHHSSSYATSDIEQQRDLELRRRDLNPLCIATATMRNQDLNSKVNYNDHIWFALSIDLHDVSWKPAPSCAGFGAHRASAWPHRARLVQCTRMSRGVRTQPKLQHRGDKSEWQTTPVHVQNACIPGEDRIRRHGPSGHAGAPSAHVKNRRVHTAAGPIYGGESGALRSNRVEGEDVRPLMFLPLRSHRRYRRRQ